MSSVASKHRDKAKTAGVPSAHSPRSPSGADTWMTCPGSVRMQAGRPDKSSEYSALGTFLHRIAANCLRFDLDPFDFVGHRAVVDGFECEMERAHAFRMQAGIDRIQNFGAEIFVEQRVSLEHWSEGDFGTLDIGGITKREIIIADWKWGAGEIVDVIMNRQLRIYGLGFWRQIARHRTKATKFRFIIMQPFVEGGEYQEWTCELEDLLAFGKEVRAAAAETRKPDAELVPSRKACRWCKAYNDCPAAAQANLMLVNLRFEDLDRAERLGTSLRSPRAEELTPERRSMIVQHADMFKRWLDLLHADALADALAGRPTPGLKAVQGRKGPRAWADKENAERLLKKYAGESAYKKSLLSPTQVEDERILSPAQWGKMQKFITQNDGKPSLVHVDHRSPAIKPTSAKFKNLDI